MTIPLAQLGLASYENVKCQDVIGNVLLLLRRGLESRLTTAVTVFQANKKRLLNEIDELAADYSEDGWDGYGAVAVQQSSIQQAKRFAELFDLFQQDSPA